MKRSALGVLLLAAAVVLFGCASQPAALSKATRSSGAATHGSPSASPTPKAAVLKQAAQNPYPAVIGTGAPWSVPTFAPCISAADVATATGFPLDTSIPGESTECIYSGDADVAIVAYIDDGSTYSDYTTSAVSMRTVSVTPYGPKAVWAFGTGGVTTEHDCITEVPMSNGHYLSVSSISTADSDSSLSPNKLCTATDRLLHRVSTQLP
jgi:hypothetical protein